MRVLLVALGRSSRVSVLDLATASLALSRRAHLLLYDPEVVGEAVVEAPENVEKGWILHADEGASPLLVKEAVRRIAEDFDALLFNDSPLSFWVAPLLAGELASPLVTDVVRVRREGEAIIVTRPIAKETLWADYELIGGKPVLVVRRGFEAPELPRRVLRLEALYASGAREGLRVLEVRKADTGLARLELANVVVGVGDGVRQSGTLYLAERLARLLGAEVACTEPLVKSGLMDRSRLVGISGRRIAPRLYLALGVSGSLYHLAGVASARIIASVNKDRSALINSYADYFYVGDLREVLPALIERLSQA